MDSPSEKTCPKAIICDIDGVIANCDHRLNRLPQWDDFFSQMHNDTLNQWAYDLLWGMVGKYPILLLTGRPKRYKEVTEEWLFRHKLPPHMMLLMRPEMLVSVNELSTKRDHRKDDVLKKEMYEQRIAGKYDVKLAIDDRDNVCYMWERLGIPTLHVRANKFAPL